MKKLIIFGLGKRERELERYINYSNVEIVAFSDNNKELWAKIKVVRQNKNKEIHVLSPEEIVGIQADVLIASSYYEEIRGQLLNLGIAEENIINGEYQELVNIKEKVKNIFINNFWEDINNYEIEGIIVRLPKETKLPKYQKKAPMYNKFFPFLAKIENIVSVQPAYIIDIGANVGDTFFSMVKYTNSKIIAVEPTDEYFDLLKENISKLPEYQSKIEMVKAYITYNENEAYNSSIKNGTAAKIISESSSIPSITIPHLLEMYNIDEKEVSLIKIDTDGFDAECILSCGDMLKRAHPLLYWENQIDNLQQFNLYNKVSEYLEEVGYNHLFIFDNFGNYLCEINSSELKSINNYLMRINCGHSTRSFYYVDILACKKDEREYCKSKIEEYNKQYILELYL